MTARLSAGVSLRGKTGQSQAIFGFVMAPDRNMPRFTRTLRLVNANGVELARSSDRGELQRLAIAMCIEPDIRQA